VQAKCADSVVPFIFWFKEEQVLLISATLLSLHMLLACCGFDLCLKDFLLDRAVFK